MSENITGSGDKFGGYNLTWKADELKKLVAENSAKIISEFALTVEGFAKKELYRGSKKKSLDQHGVATGTLRRSIHTALPGYDWGSDDVERSTGSQERGGSEVKPDISSDQLTVEVGSGMVYAMAVHQGHHSFTGYHYLSHGLDMAKRELPSIIARHQVKR